MTLSIHHLGLTVESLDEAKVFFVELLGWSVTREDSEYPSVFVSNGHVLLTLWRAKKTKPTAFDKDANIGLHHFAVQVESRQVLEKIYETLRESKFEVEFSPEYLRGGPTTHFMVYGPSQIRVEFICVE